MLPSATTEPRTVYALGQLARAVQRQIEAAAGGRSFWVRAEVAGLKVNRHAYLELAEHRAGVRVAVMRAVIWQDALARIREGLGAEADAILKEGVEILFAARATYHLVFGLSLVIEAVDPSFNLGALERRKQETLAVLRQEGLLDLNRSVPVPRVMQRIALVTSVGSAAHADFTRHLAGNEHGFRFHVQVFASAVQGDNAAYELGRAVARIDPERFDAVVLVRGGGSKLDLEAYNDLALARAVARLPLPVLTGIGHDVDTTVLDHLAGRAFKTPTDVADHLVDHAHAFERALLERMTSLRHQVQASFAEQRTALFARQGQLAHAAHTRVQGERRRMDAAVRELRTAPMRRLRQVERPRLEEAQAAIVRTAQQGLHLLAAHLRGMEDAIGLLRPEKLLERGFSITRLHGAAVNDASALRPGDEVVTTFARGHTRSTITSVEHDG
ncbi:MAG TPA: exodeoxyribonuclease VII large subunit [Flavobacteriales bacterium]|nr:exodeoxyribonuclease VII large subunit [Flavobacteriales bacterium]HMR28026.1 exodeoxyribonuclease VII large subunit [Flavobacteriales bacterium]